MGGASHAIFKTSLRYCKGKGIDIGAGFWPLPGAIPIDIDRGEGLNNAIENLEDNSLDFIFSSHCLEHIIEWSETLKGWLKKLRQGGIIFLYFPHPDCGIWNPGSPFVGNGHKWIPTPEIIKQNFKKLNY